MSKITDQKDCAEGFDGIWVILKNIGLELVDVSDTIPDEGFRHCYINGVASTSSAPQHLCGS